VTRPASEQQQFDLVTQLIDLAAALASADCAASAGLAHDVPARCSHHRALLHAMAIVQRSDAPECRGFGEYLLTVGDDEVRAGVKQAAPPLVKRSPRTDERQAAM